MKKQNIKPNVVRGGIAIPLGRNYYYMSGRKHKNGGIDIGNNPRTGLEVEDGEVMHLSKDEIKVFSSVPFLNDKSPAQKVLGGENPTKVFRQQEQFKDRHGINDDGTRKKGEWGMKEGSTADIITDVIPIVGTLKEATRFAHNPSWEQAGWTLVSLASDITGGLVGKSLIRTAKAAKAARAAGKRARVISPTFAKIAGSAVTTTGDGFINGLQMNIQNKKKRMGGLSRSKYYGSKSKPYPSVKSGDFAGRHRSYPIPTKADAVDALRLAGLHGRSDVRAKVYSKYPELRKKSKAGGLYSITVDGKTKMRMLPSTGERTKAPFGIDYELPKVIGINPEENNKYVNAMLAPVDELVSKGQESHIAKRNSPTRNKRNLFFNIKNPFKSTTGNDKLSLASNIIGTGISTIINASMLNNLKSPNKPIQTPAAKLKTNININPQLDKMRETIANYEQTVDNNTSSSRVSTARKQNARFANMLQTNELYGNKENLETELINKDKLNQQAVAAENVRNYNEWNDKVTAFNNAIAEKKAENYVSLADNINSGIQDVVSRNEARHSERQTRLAMAAAHPNVNPRILRALGIEGITDADIAAWEKAFYNKK